MVLLAISSGGEKQITADPSALVFRTAQTSKGAGGGYPPKRQRAWGAQKLSPEVSKVATSESDERTIQHPRVLVTRVKQRTVVAAEQVAEPVKVELRPLEHRHHIDMARLRLSPRKKPTPSKQRCSMSTSTRIKSGILPKTILRQSFECAAF